MCCCPTFLIAAGGPWLVVLGSVFTDKFIVQRLTDIKWMAHSSTEEDNRVYHNARVFVALRESLTKLQKFYMALQSPDHPPPFFTNQPHPRYFPYPTSFTERGSTTHFKYLTSLEEDSACVTYLAEVVDETGTTKDPKEIVVIKFVARYGRNVHEFLASKGFAPTLRYYGSFTPKLDGVYPGPAQNAPPGLCLRSDQMHMVVMEYINAPPNTLPNTQLNDDHKIQIEDILTLLHSEGYVFGDLRRLNILLGADGKVRLIDFNWCGRYDMKAKIPDGILPDKLRKMINENKDRVHGQLGNGPYVYYPLSISTVEGMWAEGMEPLLEIRPEHDWLMLHKLFPLPTA
jgi:serine/threonine protein kinase